MGGEQRVLRAAPAETDTGNAVSPRSFAAGDIALYNGLSLVIFYAATTQTSGYVKIGHIDGTSLKESLDRAKGSVSGTDRKIGALYKGATVKSALALRGSVAQNRRSEAQSAVDKWYAALGL